LHRGVGGWQTPAVQRPLQQSLGPPHARPGSVHGLCAAHVMDVGSQIALQHSVQLAHVTPFAEHDASASLPASAPASCAITASMLASETSAASSITNAASTLASIGLPASSRGGA
jgi:hypothetical protein